MMNERIKQLAEQARNLVDHDYEYLPEEADRVELIHEKFAELIIKECMGHVTWVGKINEKTSVSPIQTAHAINKRITNHLGIE